MSKAFISESSPVSGQRQGAPERGPRTPQGQADTSASPCIHEITTGTESSGLETWSFTMDCLRSTMDIKRGCDLGLKVTNGPWWKPVHQIWSCDKDLKDDVAPQVISEHWNKKEWLGKHFPQNDYSNFWEEKPQEFHSSPPLPDRASIIFQENINWTRNFSNKHSVKERTGKTDFFQSFIISQKPLKDLDAWGIT